MNKRAPEKPVVLEQRPDVEVDKGMPEKETQPHSLADYDMCQDLEEEEFQGSSLNLGLTSFDAIIMTSLRTKIVLSCRASSGLSK